MPNDFQLLSFDLDDALYNNKPILANAEEVSSAYLQQQFQAQGKQFNIANFNQLKQKLLNSDDIAYENLSYFRLQALNRICAPLNNSVTIAKQAFEIFIQARSQIVIPEPIQQLLAELSTAYTLVSVSNGNCDINRSSIGPYFSKNYSPVDGYRAKPHPQMLLKVMKDFTLTADQLLHIGDSYPKDGTAAKNAGVDFFHFAPFTHPDKLKYCCQQLQQYLKPVEC